MRMKCAYCNWEVDQVTEVGICKVCDYIIPREVSRIRFVCGWIWNTLPKTLGKELLQLQEKSGKRIMKRSDFRRLQILQERLKMYLLYHLTETGLATPVIKEITDCGVPLEFVFSLIRSHLQGSLIKKREFWDWFNRLRGRMNLPEPFDMVEFAKRYMYEGYYGPPKQFVVIRDVTVEQCPWLRETIKAGTVVIQHLGSSYGVCSKNGILVFKPENPHRSFELPLDSIAEIDKSNITS